MLALFAASCASTSVQVSGGGPQPAASAPGNSAFGALLLLGFIVSAEAHHDGARYRASPFDALAPGPLRPPLDPSRRVLEQDCTKPIEDWSANLKCR
jgi:hypothetical protein